MFQPKCAEDLQEVLKVKLTEEGTHVLEQCYLESVESVEAS